MRETVEGKLYRCASKIRDRGNKGKMHLSGKRSRWGERRVARGGEAEEEGGEVAKPSGVKGTTLGWVTRRDEGRTFEVSSGRFFQPSERLAQYQATPRLTNGRPPAPTIRPG